MIEFMRVAYAPVSERVWRQESLVERVEVGTGDINMYYPILHKLDLELAAIQVSGEREITIAFRMTEREI
jgi:hypothetical protein